MKKNGKHCPKCLSAQVVRDGWRPTPGLEPRLIALHCTNCPTVFYVVRPKPSLVRKLTR